MCLAIPGQIVSVQDTHDPMARTGIVDFSGVARAIGLAYVPDAQVGDYVVVHAGIALSVLDTDDALASLQAMAALNDCQNDTDVDLDSSTTDR